MRSLDFGLDGDTKNSPPVPKHKYVPEETVIVGYPSDEQIRGITKDSVVKVNSGP